MLQACENQDQSASLRLIERLPFLLTVVLPTLRPSGGLCHRTLIESDRSLCQQSAAHRCASIHGDHCLGQYDSFKVGGRSNGHCTSGLPEDILGQCTTDQSHFLTGSLVKISCYLEDPDIVWTTRERDIR